MKQDESDEKPTLLICPLCRTHMFGESAKALKGEQREHNENQHDGERIAERVDPKHKHVIAFANGIERDYNKATKEAVMSYISKRTDWLV